MASLWPPPSSAHSLLHTAHLTKSVSGSAVTSPAFAGRKMNEKTLPRCKIVIGDFSKFLCFGKNLLFCLGSFEGS